MEPCCSRFTAAEGGARLAVTAGKQNTLAVEYANFISTRLIYEEAYKIRGYLSQGRQRSVFISRASRVPCVAYEIKIMTDLKTSQACNHEEVYDWHAELENNEVLVCTSEVLERVLREEVVGMMDINVLIVDSCHRVYKDDSLKYIMSLYRQCSEGKRPRILALTYPLFTLNKKVGNEQKNLENDRTYQNEEVNEKEGSKEESGIDHEEEFSKVRDVKEQNKIEIEKDCTEVMTEDKFVELIEESENKESIKDNTKAKVVELEVEDDKVRVAIEIKEEKESIEEKKEKEIGESDNLDDFDLYEKLEWKIGELEKELCARMDLAEDIDGGKRVSASVTKPKELVIEYTSKPDEAMLTEDYIDLDKYMRDTITEALLFLDDHRHDPTEIYGEELYEEFKNIPDPTLDPKSIFKQFLYVLDQLGPYAADKAAFSLLSTLEKLKIKVPYERHFLLLCLSTTVFVKIRCYADLMFEKYSNDWERIKHFSTPKVMRFAEVLEQFQPPDNNQKNERVGIDTQKEKENKPNVVYTTQKLLGDIEKCDFTTLGDRIEDRVNTYAANLKDLDDYSVIEDEKNSNHQNSLKNDEQTVEEKGISRTNDKIDLQSIDALESVSDVDIHTKVEEFDDTTTKVNDTETSNDAQEFNKTQNGKMEVSSKIIVCETNNRVVNVKDCNDDIVNVNDRKKTYDEQEINKNVEIEGSFEIIEFETKTNQNTKGKDHDDVQELNKQTVKIEGSSKTIERERTNQETQLGGSFKLGFTRRQGHRPRGRGRVIRNNARLQQFQQNPDALCGIVFLKEGLMAKIMFMLVADMSRSYPKLSYLCAQYCAVEQNEEPRECQRQGKKREEVLKKFRMHECNLLLATPALEEGIDLPRCNLVLRWDLPQSYRSYGLCRGRARANRAMAGLLCVDTERQVDTLLQNLAVYRELDQVINRKCGCGIQNEPSQAEEDHADTYTLVIKPYTPLEYINNDRLLTKIRNNVQKCSENSSISSISEKVPPNNVCNLSKNHKEARNKERSRRNDNTHNAAMELKTKDDENTKESVVCKKSSNEIDQSICIIEGKTNDIIVDNNLVKAEEPNSIGKLSQEENYKDIEVNLKYNHDIKHDQNAQSNSILGSNIEDKVISNENDITNLCKTFDVVVNVNIDINGKSQIKEIVDDSKRVYENTYCKKCTGIKSVNVECTCILNLNDDGMKYSGMRNIDNGVDDNDYVIINNANIGKGTADKENDEMNTENFKNTDGVIKTDGCRIANNIEKTKIFENDSEKKLCGDKDNSDKCRIIDRTEEIRNSLKDIRDCISGIKGLPTNVGLLNDENRRSLSRRNCGLLESDGGPLLNGAGIDSSHDVKIKSIERMRYDVKTEEGVASVDLSSAIALINRYCGKLPSDTFTRLAPQWWMEEVQLSTRNGTRTGFVCTLRLPLNCPVKNNIVGHPMPTRVLARRMVALQACRILHRSGELDDQLMPIGKENFKSAEMETTNYSENETNDFARPGTTKRRQYYYKRTASAFTDCQPVIDCSDSDIEKSSTEETALHDRGDCTVESKKGIKRNMLYAIVSRLWCALPERYNTRGRRLHAPQTASQAIGILMARTHADSLQIPAFPVYTRSGEVRVSVEFVPDADVRMSPRRGRLVRRFMRFVFAEVLRVRRRGMRLQSEGSTHNNYYIVPTIKTIREDGTPKIDVDWSFLELIYQHTEQKKKSEIEKTLICPQEEEDDDEEQAGTEVAEKTKEEGTVKKMENPLLKSGETFVFDPEKYKEAVVTPWYRNQDQPQFFLVAEICWNLTPDSAFPSASHSSFREYYYSKYGAALTQPDQPLLDVDHTSARLNLLTPRYVNRKGVALPVSSERTRRAKRDRLDQKQILVPELTRVHPFAAPLWFATVALPCVLYRINALLIADEIRRAVAIDVGLGVPKIDEKTMPGFQWPPLDFGWSLAEVLNADSSKNEKKKELEDGKKENIEKESRDKDEKEIEAIQKKQEEAREKTINDILQEKEEESGFEIGTWSNEMASSIPQESEYDEFMEPLPANLTFCTSSSGGTNWCDPIERPKNDFNPTRIYSMADSDCSNMSSDFDTDDSDLDSSVSDEETDTSGFWSSKHSSSLGVRIEYKTAHEAEAVDLDRKVKVNPAPEPDEEDDLLDKLDYDRFMRSGKAPPEYIEKFRASVTKHREDIMRNGLIKSDEAVKEMLPAIGNCKPSTNLSIDSTILEELFPYGWDCIEMPNGQITLESVEKNKIAILSEVRKQIGEFEARKMNCFSMRDVIVEKPKTNVFWEESENKPYYQDGGSKTGSTFDFDYQPNLDGHPGPSPSVILQALTMSNANDGINLERLETIGDSFLKFAITAYLYCAQPTVHEGKLSHMRSKQVSNLNLYRLGRNKRLGARMIASKFEPHDNWLPPCYKAPPTLHTKVTGTAFAESKDQQQNVHNAAEALLDSSGCFIPYNLITQHSIPDKSIADCVEALIGAYLLECGPRGALLFMSWLGIRVLPKYDMPYPNPPPKEAFPRNTESKCEGNQESKVQKSTPPSPKRDRHSSTSSECSSYDEEQSQETEESVEHEEQWWWRNRKVGSLKPYIDENGKWMQTVFGELKPPPSPLLRYIDNPEGELEQMLSGYDALERTLEYRFKDRSLLLQALTHASHHKNRLTDCYQRLEFLGDAILDYLITRHLYEDVRRHCPGALTDLRSALVNNTIFATLAARHGFHKYFRHMSPGLNEVLTKYVKIQEENGHSISEEHYLIQEDEMEQAEDVEVPKALGDLFESVAGAIFLDSGMSLGAVWKSYVKLMGKELEAFSAAAPKSPVRELLEAEPDTAKFGKPERLADGRRVRVCVEVFGRGAFKGIGRNYRIAKGTAARCALRHLRLHKR